VPAQKIRCVPNGVDDWMVAAASAGDPAPDARPPGSDRFRIVYVGAHGKWNGLGQILDAAALLRDDPRIEFENFSSAYDGLRPDKGDPEFSEERYHAWCRGQTGYPLVDACMRALHATGWINFRMRAMLVSFASYHLWLHWRPTAVFLARHFLDFEPGIHFSQFQMQSGTTGINTVRIYSPTKQALDHDACGDFVRAWVPELERVPATYIVAPHKMPASVQSQVGCLINRHYPAPIVDHAYAYQRARRLIGEIRRQPNAREEAERIQSKHGSRRSGIVSNSPRAKRSETSKQASLFDDSP
jgi:deoxyribodipyrimidine photo-lyase